MKSSQKFADLLTEAIYQIRAHENKKPIGVIQDELGYAIGKKGGSAIEHWRKGNVPRWADLEALTKKITHRGNLRQPWVEQFLSAAGYPFSEKIFEELFPQASTYSEPLIQLPESAEYNLPAKPYQMFIGREEILSQATVAMADPNRHWIVAIDGAGGMGKTAISYKIVDSLQKGAFSNIIWINVAEYADHQGESLFTFEALLDILCPYLRVPDFQKLSYIEKCRRVKERLDREKQLLVLDSLHTASESQNKLADALLQLLGHSKALLTSRHRFTGSFFRLHLDGLESEDAQQLIQQEAKNRHVNYIQAAHASDLQPLITMTGGSPLAMKLVVGQLGHLSLPVILKRLQTANSLAYGQSEDNQLSLYQSLYAPSWQKLSEDGKQLLIGMTLLIADVGGTVSEVQAICNLSETKVTAAIDELWRLSLVEASSEVDGDWGQLQYSLHALTQQFVLSEIIDLNGPSPSNIAKYGLFTENLARGLRYMKAQIQVHGPSLPPLASRNLTLHMLNYALPIQSLWSISSQVLLLLAPKMEQAAHREDEWRRYLERGMTRSQEIGDRQTKAELSFHLGILQQQCGRYDSAHRAFESALLEFEQIDEEVWQARTMIRQAQIYRLQSRYEESHLLVNSALALLDEGHVEHARGYHVQGCAAFDRQAWGEAADLFQQALALWEREKDQRAIAWGLTTLGAAYRPLGKFKEAIICYTKAIVLLDEIQDPLHRAVTQMNLGNVYLARQDLNQALEMYLLAEPIFLKVKDELRLASNYTNKGIVYQKMAQWDKAVDAFQESVRLYRQIGRINSLANALNGLGLTLMGKERYMEAITAYQEALSQLEQIDEKPKESKIYQEIEMHLEEALTKLI